MTYQSAIPVLPSLDIKESHDFFVEKLGFDAHFIWHEDKSKPPPYGGVKKGDVHIHFVIVDDKKVCEWTITRIYVTGIESHYEQAQKNGVVHPNSTLQEQPWGERDFAVLDPSGVCIHIAEELERS